MTIGERLKEERNRVGANQTVFAEQCGVTKNTQLAYEKGERSPDANYLAAAAAAGVDVQYVVTGERRPQPAGSISAEEADLLDRFRQLPAEDRAGLDKIITAMSAMAGNYQAGKR
ncbi:helix-turn-helix transcriptional regulator [Pseudomonas aeruginosa]|uniref:helix-turn-helix domain-containing protein n=1 Tax=Pseudomonas aeruginosa TaxID=287 RepID=UPI00249AE8F9|nr:helix-turn-helix transcriptional regulator [Pseudomonas aeruginosa]EIU3915809.1 helix-turn-helix transcriptional regulator [Pseudomonas aeruginosa]WGW43511.1 helix-turn-helix transcriptional regulator [Pseudomonas aeruginosa]